MVRRDLRAAALRVDRRAVPVDDEFVEGVLEVAARIRLAEQPAAIGLVLREEPGRVGLAVQPVRAQLRRLRHDDVAVERQFGFAARIAPRPRVAKPQLRQHIDVGVFRTAIVDRDPDQNVRRRRLRVFGDDVEVAIGVEDAGVEQLELRIEVAAPPVFFDQLRIRESPLGILVERLEIGVRGRRVQVVVALLDVLAVVAFAVGQAEQPLLQDRVVAVPQRQGETQDLLIVADAVQAVLTPAVGPAAGGVVAERFPGRPARTVVLADGAPLTLAQVRAPLLPSESPRAHSSGFLRPWRLDAAACRTFRETAERVAHRTGMATRAPSLHWPEYLIEAGAIGTFMVSAAVFAAVLYYPSSPMSGAVSNELVRRALMGLAMGATAVAIIYSPWGQRSGAHMNPAVTLTFFRLGKVASAGPRRLRHRSIRRRHRRDRRGRRRPCAASSRTPRCTTSRPCLDRRATPSPSSRRRRSPSS